MQYTLALSGALAFCVNLSGFLVIGKATPVTYNVVTHCKTVVVILGGFLLFGSPLVMKATTWHSCTFKILVYDGIWSPFLVVPSVDPPPVSRYLRTSWGSASLSLGLFLIPISTSRSKNRHTPRPKSPGRKTSRQESYWRHQRRPFRHIQGQSSSCMHERSNCRCSETQCQMRRTAQFKCRGGLHL
jgi:hypothetical protein